MNPNDKNFTCLNREGRWQGHHWDGLNIGPDGALRLKALPLLEGILPLDVAQLPKPDGPAGIAVDASGTVYFTDPEGNRVLRIDGCDGKTAPAPCMGGLGCAPGQLSSPRGLLIPQWRQALYVADSGNHRIQVFDLATSQLLEVWGPAAGSGPQPGSLPGEFNTPWTLAADSAGNIYVVDYGNKRIQKFDALGQVVPSFWSTLAAAEILTQPGDVAVMEADGTAIILVVDISAHAVFVIGADGNPVRDAQGNPVSFGSQELQEPMGIAAIDSAIYVGDNARRRVLEFDASDHYKYVGEAVGYDGPVAALAPDGKGGLLVHTGAPIAPVRLLIGQAYGKQGVFWSEAVKAPGDKVVWHRLEAIAESLAPDAHIQFFRYTSDNVADAPAPPVLNSSASNPFTDPKWQAEPADVTDFFIGGRPTLYFWVGAWFSGSGLTSPVVSQIRVEFNHETYLVRLPAIYQKPGVCADFLLRFLSLFESFYSETESKIKSLPSLFDPAAAPAEYLPWLAGWLALQLDEDWDEATQRSAISDAFANYALRGTPAGLRKVLKQYAGVDAVIQEPIMNAAWWALPAPEAACPSAAADPSQPPSWQAGENSVLGFTTMLAPGPAQGAVVGTSAVLDQSAVITDEDFGAPLFSDVAWQFSVQVSRGQLRCPEKLAEVIAVLDQEKPAHTAYHLCVIEPSMRVGFQARVGVDTIIGGAPPSLRLGETSTLGQDTALAGPPAPRAGEGIRLGGVSLA